MTPETLLAEAAQADREADALFATIHAAGLNTPADRLGYRPLVPTGMAARAERASDLRRKAARLRAEAAELAPPINLKRDAFAPVPPPSPSFVPPTTAAGQPSELEPEIDPVEALVARIMGA
jgi:hypothetical protein